MTPLGSTSRVYAFPKCESRLGAEFRASSGRVHSVWKVANHSATEGAEWPSRSICTPPAYTPRRRPAVTWSIWGVFRPAEFPALSYEKKEGRATKSHASQRAFQAAEHAANLCLLSQASPIGNQQARPRR